MKFFVALVVSLALVGCAKSPQQVSFDPKPVQSAVWVGKGALAELQVVDARQITDIGSRGGIYKSTSTLSLDNRATEDMSIYLQSRLLSAGFKLGNVNPATSWTVKLSELTYDYVKVKGVRDQVDVYCVVSVEVVRGLSVYTNTYRASLSNEVLTLASNDKNQEWVNAAINAALDQLFQDQGIAEFLK